MERAAALAKHSASCKLLLEFCNPLAQLSCACYADKLASVMILVMAELFFIILQETLRFLAFHACVQLGVECGAALVSASGTNHGTPLVLEVL